MSRLPVDSGGEEAGGGGGGAIARHRATQSIRHERVSAQQEVLRFSRRRRLHLLQPQHLRQQRARALSSCVPGSFRPRSGGGTVLLLSRYVVMGVRDESQERQKYHLDIGGLRAKPRPAHGRLHASVLRLCHHPMHCPHTSATASLSRKTGHNRRSSFVRAACLGSSVAVEQRGAQTPAVRHRDEVLHLAAQHHRRHTTVGGLQRRRRRRRRRLACPRNAVS